MYRLGKEMDSVLAFKQFVGADAGACFGTRDVSRLRPVPVRKRLADKSLQDEEKKGKPVPAMRVIKKKKSK
jgi:hypothetical protein